MTTQGFTLWKNHNLLHHPYGWNFRWLWDFHFLQITVGAIRSEFSRSQQTIWSVRYLVEIDLSESRTEEAGTGKREVELWCRPAVLTEAMTTERAHQSCPVLSGNDQAFVTSGQSITRWLLFWERHDLRWGSPLQLRLTSKVLTNRGCVLTTLLP